MKKCTVCTPNNIKRQFKKSIGFTMTAFPLLNAYHYGLNEKGHQCYLCHKFFTQSQIDKCCGGEE